MHARVVAVLLVTSTSIATGDAPHKPATVVPTVAVPCLPDQATLAMHADLPALCWDAGCMTLDLGDGTAELFKGKPTPVPRWLSPLGDVRDDGGKPSVCNAKACKPLGKKLVTAIAEARAAASADSPAVIEGTQDLKAVAVRGEIWNVATDRPLKIRPPKTRDHDPLFVAGATVAGDLIVMQWTNCAGPCTQATIVDSSGAQKAGLFTGGWIVTQIDAKRFAVVDESGTVHVFAVGTGAAKATIDLPSYDPQVDALRIDGSLYVKHPAAHGSRITQIRFDDPVRVGSEMFLPSCP